MRIVICGGGLVGLAAGLVLARAGHDVTLLESDREAPPDPIDAWGSWGRPGVAQFHQPHNLFPRVRQILQTELPDLVGDLLAAGCVELDLLSPLPPTIPDQAPRPGDERFRAVTGRRPVVEAVFAAAAAHQPGLTVRRAARAVGLLTRGSRTAGPPAVVGVRTAAGDELRADLVVDAMGRRTPCDRWLAEVGAPAPAVESEDGGFVYYTRYFAGPELPARRAAPYSAVGTFSLLTLAADNGTWSVTVVGSGRDAPLREVRRADVFGRLVAACPAHRQWLAGRPITPVLAMAGILDRSRRLVVDGRPVVTGLVPLGDAWACTNPSGSRGVTLGLLQVQLLRDVLRWQAGDPGGLVAAWDEGTERVVAPFYRDQVTTDRSRLAEMDALRADGPPPEADPARAGLAALAQQDADAFRLLLEVETCLTPLPEVLARPGLRERLPPAAGGGGTPGPDRAGLLQLLGA